MPDLTLLVRVFVPHTTHQLLRDFLPSCKYHSILTPSTETSCSSQEGQSAFHKGINERLPLNKSGRQNSIFGKFHYTPSSGPPLHGDVFLWQDAPSFTPPCSPPSSATNPDHLQLKRIQNQGKRCQREVCT